MEELPEKACHSLVTDRWQVELEGDGCPLFVNVGGPFDNDGGVNVEHSPCAPAIADRGAVMHFTRIDGDDVASPGLDDTTPTRRFLRTPLDHANTELLVGMPAEDECRIRFHRFDATSSTTQQFKSLVSHPRWSL